MLRAKSSLKLKQNRFLFLEITKFKFNENQLRKLEKINKIKNLVEINTKKKTFHLKILQLINSGNESWDLNTKA